MLPLQKSTISEDSQTQLILWPKRMVTKVSFVLLLALLSQSNAMLVISSRKLSGLVSPLSYSFFFLKGTRVVKRQPL